MSKYYISKGLGCGDISLIKEESGTYHEFNRIDLGNRYELQEISFSIPLEVKYPDALYDTISEEEYEKEYNILIGSNYIDKLIWEYDIKEEKIDSKHKIELNLSDKQIDLLKNIIYASKEMYEGEDYFLISDIENQLNRYK